MTKIAMINQPLGNRGDQAAHRALMWLLQQHQDIETTVLSFALPEAVREFARDTEAVTYVAIAPFRKRRGTPRRAMYLPKVSRRLLELIPRIREYNAVIRSSDYVLCAPGGICMGGYRNWQHLWELANALAWHKRTGIYGRSIGPFANHSLSDRVFRRRAIEILRHVDLLPLRDGFSQQLAA